MILNQTENSFLKGLSLKVGRGRGTWDVGRGHAGTWDVGTWERGTWRLGDVGTWARGDARTSELGDARGFENVINK